MTPTTYLTYRKDVRESIVFLLSAEYRIHACDMEQILHQVNPVMMIELKNDQAIKADITYDVDAIQFKNLISNFKPQAI